MSDDHQLQKLREEFPRARRGIYGEFFLEEISTDFWEKVTGVKVDVRALAQSYLDRPDEDWTFVDPEDVKRLARAVLEK